MSSDHHRVSRLIRMASEIKTNPEQEPPALIRSLGISKPQFYKDKRALEKLGFSFRYDRTQKRFIIDRDPYIPIYDLTLTGSCPCNGRSPVVSDRGFRSDL